MLPTLFDVADCMIVRSQFGVINRLARLCRTLADTVKLHSVVIMSSRVSQRGFGDAKIVPQGRYGIAVVKVTGGCLVVDRHNGVAAHWCIGNHNMLTRHVNTPVEVVWGHNDVLYTLCCDRVESFDHYAYVRMTLEPGEILKIWPHGLAARTSAGVTRTWVVPSLSNYIVDGRMEIHVITPWIRGIIANADPSLKLSDAFDRATKHTIHVVDNVYDVVCCIRSIDAVRV